MSGVWVSGGFVSGVCVSSVWISGFWAVVMSVSGRRGQSSAPFLVILKRLSHTCRITNVLK